jgi:hypothetical protein
MLALEFAHGATGSELVDELRDALHSRLEKLRVKGGDAEPPLDFRILSSSTGSLGLYARPGVMGRLAADYLPNLSIKQVSPIRYPRDTLEQVEFARTR